MNSVTIGTLKDILYTVQENLNHEAKWRTATAVSYTHLDVYKRQGVY